MLAHCRILLLCISVHHSTVTLQDNVYILGWAWGLLVAINSYVLAYNLYKCSYNPYKLYNPLTKSPKSPEGYNHTYI